MDFFQVFNRFSAAEILSRIELTVAKDGKSYVCPICGHGKGGDGIRPKTNNKGQMRWHCFGCGEDFSNFDLAGAVLGLNPETEKAELARRLKELFVFDDDDELTRRMKELCRRDDNKQPARSDKKISGSVKTMASEQATVEPKDFSGLYYVCRGNRAKFLDEQGGSYRAITAAMFEKYGVEVHSDFEFTKDGEKIKLPALIIPYVKGTTVDNGHFVARSISDTVKAVSQHGQAAPLYEPLPISADNVANFIVESELDALSIAQVFDGDNGIGVAATGGASKWRKVVDELKKRFDTDERTPKIIVMFDNDDKGKFNAQALAPALRAANFPAEIFFLEGGLAGTVVTNSAGKVTATIAKVDANDLLKRGGGELFKRLVEAIEVTGDKLDSQAATMRATLELAKATPIRRSGINTISVAEYFKTDFFADVELTSRYSSRSTGFENLDAAQIFLPGLYVVGAKPGLGKTTFVWQLLNQLADNGEFCVYASYEMSRFELATKTLARELYKAYPNLSRRLNLSSANIRRGAGKGLSELNRLAENFSSSKENLHVAELTNTSISELCKHVRELSEQAQKPCTFALDYLQIVPSKNVKATTKEKIDDAMLQLKNFQRDTGATVIVISAFNRANGNDAEFSSFRESSSIEYSADCLWALQYRDDGDDEDNSKATEPRPMELKCLKNRNGAPYTVQFDYYAAYDYFVPCEAKKRSSYGH